MTSGVKYMLLATAFFTLMNVGVKYLERIPVYEIVTFRAAVTLVVGYLLIKRAGLSPWGNNKPLLLLRGLSGTVALVFYFTTLQMMPLSSAVTIQYLSPIFTIVIAGFMLREYTRGLQWLFFLLAFGGVVLVKGFDPRVTPAGLAMGIVAALFSGLAYNFIRKLKDHDDALVVVFYFPLVTLPLVGSYTAFHWVQPDLGELGILLLVGLLTTAMQIFMTKAYQSDRASNISIYNYLGTVYAIVIGYLVFAEPVTAMAALGFALIIFGVVMGTHYRRENSV